MHTTFQYGGAEGKRHRLREATMWEDERSYYDPAGGLLRYEPDIPIECAASHGPHASHLHCSRLQREREPHIPIECARSLSLFSPPATGHTPATCTARGCSDRRSSLDAIATARDYATRLTSDTLL